MTQRVDKDSLPLDKPRRTPGHPTKSHIVKTKVDGKERIIRFGEQGASTAGKPKAGESERMKAKRASFKARHAKNIAKGKSSPAYWANRVKWAEGGPVELREMYAKYAEGGEVEDLGVYEQLVEAERRARLRAASPLERQTYETLGMEPGLDRAAFLPFAGSRRGGDLQLAAPQFIYDIGKAFITPGAAARGVPLSYDDVINTAVNTMGGGLAISSPVEGAVAGMAVKQKGGNWLPGHVEDSLRPLRRRNVNNTDPAEVLLRLEEKYGPEGAAEVLASGMYPNIKEDAAINRWIDTKLARYIKNEMATPEDPVRALADQGVLHFEPPPRSMRDLELLYELREEQGMPTDSLAKTDLGAAWEENADAALQIIPAETYQNFGSSNLGLDWVNKLDPQTPFYWVYPHLASHNLGFNHLIDELRIAINPASGLPRNLQIDPKDLNKISMPQAVERVARINAWRAEQKVAADAARAANAATVPFRTYETIPSTDLPNERGLRWVELALPSAQEDVSSMITQNAGKYSILEPGQLLSWKDPASGRVLFDTPEEASAAYNRSRGVSALEESLKYEGEVMGHCVGGYCPDVEAGRSRIYSLRDAKGEPHVTVEVKPWRSSQGETLEEFERRLRADPNRSEEAVQQIMSTPHYADEIVQIKGKQNRAPNAEYLPFVQDFVRSGQWGRVGDLENTGLYRADPDELGMFTPQNPALQELPGRRTDYLRRAQQAGLFPEGQKYLTRDEWEGILRQQIESESGRLPNQGYAKGGAVQPRSYNPAHIDAIISGINRPGFAAGGAVSTYDPTIINALVNNVLKGIPNG